MEHDQYNGDALHAINFVSCRVFSQSSTLLLPFTLVVSIHSSVFFLTLLKHLDTRNPIHVRITLSATEFLSLQCAHLDQLNL